MIAQEHPDIILKALKDAGCLDPVHAAGIRVLADMESSRPELAGLLTVEARDSLLHDYEERVLLLYAQVLIKELKDRLKKHDPVGLLIGKPKPEAIRTAAEELAHVNAGDVEGFLHEEYPLLKEYRACTDRNFRNSFSAFFDALILCKKEIEERFLERKTIRRILSFSTGGADIHRHGKCVVGIKTDAGSFYYKPHDCGLDAFYHAVVSRWFSDCTVAADVLSRDGYAFVSCLVREPLREKDQLPDYYYHFGILSALFHGLGSTDMHYENLMAVGDRPSAVDIETLLGLPTPDTGEEIPELRLAQKDYQNSLVRTSLLPARIYKGPMISPLYFTYTSSASLPELEGKPFTVEGFEEDFIRGFHEGYRRMLSHRDEIAEMLKAMNGASVRVLIRNTRFYGILRGNLFLPEHLSDETSRRKVYEELRSPYKGAAADRDRDLSDHEWKCLLDCDIPYFCTALDARDLCGEDPSQTVRTGYYRESTLESAIRFLGRLSKEEERFETELMRHSFAHAPTDVPKETEETPLSEEIPDDETIRKELGEISAELKKDVVRCTDGTLLWFSTALNVKGLVNCGNLTQYAEIGAFCTAFAKCELPDALKNDAGRTARTLCSLLRKELARAKTEWTDKVSAVLPSGICTGIGGILKACCFMERSGLKEADGLKEEILRLIAENKLYEYRELSLSEGAAGLVIALADAGLSDEDAKGCLRSCADRLLAEDLPKRADSAYGCAGIGAALAAAFSVLGDERYYKGALRAFTNVSESYDPKLSGWPDGAARIKFLAGKGPHAAGICLSAVYAKEKLLNTGAPCTDELSDLTDQIAETALKSLLSEKALTHSDALEQGNALSVLALLNAGDAAAAGRVLSAMLKRKERTGSFAILSAGIRSTFDPSFFMGTLGIGYAMIAYLNRS